MNTHTTNARAACSHAGFGIQHCMSQGATVRFSHELWKAPPKCCFKSHMMVIALQDENDVMLYNRSKEVECTGRT